jgi:hypothetical protein
MGFETHISRPARLAPLSALLVAVALVLAAPAAAEYYVPPGNSAANQYTESVPSAGGERGGHGKGGVTPAQALGAKNAHRLESTGPAGKAAANLAAATSPTATIGGHNPAGQSGGQGPGGQGGGPGSGGQGSQGGETAGGGEAGHGSRPSGSSGLSEVLGQATGSSGSGNLGLWLPIILLAALVGAIAYRWAPRHKTTS